MPAAAPPGRPGPVETAVPHHVPDRVDAFCQTADIDQQIGLERVTTFDGESGFRPHHDHTRAARLPLLCRQRLPPDEDDFYADPGELVDEPGAVPRERLRTGSRRDWGFRSRQILDEWKLGRKTREEKVGLFTTTPLDGEKIHD